MISALQKFSRSVLIIVAVLLVLVGIAFGIARTFLPLAAGYRAELEQLIGESIGNPVRIGAMDVRWVGWGPEIQLQNVALISAQDGTDLLQLDEVWMGLQLGHALFAGELQIADVQLEGIQILLQRNRDGSVSVRGVRGDNNSATEVNDNAANALGILLLSRRIDLLDASIVLGDIERGIEYIFPKAYIHIENDGEQHNAYAQIVLPEELGEQIEVHFDFRGEATKPEDWVGTVHVSGSALQLSEFMDNIPDSPINLPNGIVDFAVWSEWHDGRMQFFNAEFAGEKLAAINTLLVDDPTVPEWQVDAVSAQANWRRIGDGWDLAVNNIRVTRNGVDWPRNDLRVVTQLVEGEPLISASGRFLPVEESAALAMAVIADDASGAMMRRVRAMKPRGELRDWRVEYAPHRVPSEALKLAGTLKGIAYLGDAQLPGLSGLNGQFRSIGAALELDIDSDEFVADVRPMFRDVIGLSRLQGRVQARFGESVHVASDHLLLENVDLKASTRLDIQYHDKHPLKIDLQANFSDGYGANTGKYLPVSIMSSDLVDWLDQAIVGGRISNGSLLFRGAAKDFPFRSQEGVFEVDFAIEDTELDYFPEWPAIKDGVARVQFLGPSLTVHATGGSFSNAELDNVIAYIDNLHIPVIELEGALHSTVPELLEFATEGPLSPVFASSLGEVSGSGDATLALRVKLPLFDLENLSTDGGITFRDASLRHSALDIDVTQIVGTVQFNEVGLRAKDVHAQALGAPLVMNAGPRVNNQDGAGTNLTVRTDVEVAKALRALNMPLAERVDGVSSWLVELDLAPPTTKQRDGDARLTVSSDLVGTGIDLPSPLSKPQARPTTFAVSLVMGGKNSFKDWQLDYSDVLRARSTPLSDGQNSIISIHLGDSALPEKTNTAGIHLSGHLQTLDSDDWLSVVDQIINHYDSAESGAFDTAVYTDLSIDQFTVAGKRVDDMAVVVDSRPGAWSLATSSSAFEGTATLQRPYNKSQPLYINLAELNYDALQPVDESASSAVAAPALLPTDIPPFVATVDELTWLGYRFINAKAVATHQDARLRLDSLTVGGSSLTGSGEGEWVYQPDSGTHVTSLEMQFDSDNLGTTLEELQQDALVDEGRGKVKIELKWPDALYRPDTERMIGSANIDLSSGRILNIDPGAGRLVGLLAITELPRRLRLDFKDALRGGLEFDKVSGNLDISGGIARTDLLRLSGPIGVIDVSGDTNFVDQTYNQRIVVLPRLGSSLPLLGVLTGGVGTGLAVLISEGILKNIGVDVDKLGKREYTLQGSWEAPVIEEVVVEIEKIEPGERSR